MYDIFYIGPKDDEWRKLKSKFPLLKRAESFSEAKRKSFTKFFWTVWDDITVVDTFDFSYEPDSGSQEYIHLFLNGDYYDGIALFPKSATPSEKEIKHRFFINKKEVPVLASVPKPFNIFYIDNYESYLTAINNSTSEMFWVVWKDVNLVDGFNFDYYVPVYDTFHRNITHVFKNDKTYDGICLFSKNKHVTEREFNHRFFVDKTEVDIVASHPKPFDVYHISNYDEYLLAAKQSTTEMFWAVWSDVELTKDFNFDYYVPVYDTFHRNITHVFKNDQWFDGVCLFSKHNLISKKEISHRFFIDKKEVDIVASHPKPFDKFVIENFDSYKNALENSKTEMFWAIWPEIELLDNSVLNLYFSHHNSYDRNENHVWKNLCNDKESYIHGLTLFSKNNPVSKREIDYKMLVNRKEHDEVASRFRYPRYYIDSYDDYVKVYNTEKSPLFWAIWPEIETTDNNIFDLYYDPLDGTFDYDRNENHVFKNQDVTEIMYNGLMLLSTLKNPLSKKEVDFRYIIEKKEHDLLASRLKQYDIVFISYNEPNAEANWLRLKTKFPRAMRIHGVKGIHQAHIKAASLCTTPMFWVVDGDAEIVDDFDFSLLLPKHDRDIVHVWRSRNPINDLEYGNGGVKLLPRIQTLNVDVNSPDMTTSISSKFRAMEQVSNYNMFNTSDFSTWRSAFRECVKLASRTIKGQVDEETSLRLETWCNKGADRLYGEWAIRGALEGRAYGEFNKDNVEALKQINNFDWLYEQFSKHTIR